SNDVVKSDSEEHWAELEKKYAIEPVIEVKRWGGEQSLLIKNFSGEDSDEHVAGFVFRKEYTVCMLQIVPENKSSLLCVYDGKMYRIRYNLLFGGLKELDWFADNFIKQIKDINK